MKPPKTIIGGNRGNRSNGREWVISPPLEREHVIPEGAKLAFVRNDKQASGGPEYLFWVLLPDEPLPPPLNQTAIAAANAHDAANMGEDYVPY